MMAQKDLLERTASHPSSLVLMFLHRTVLSNSIKVLNSIILCSWHALMLSCVLHNSFAFLTHPTYWFSCLLLILQGIFQNLLGKTSPYHLFATGKVIYTFHWKLIIKSHCLSELWELWRRLNLIIFFFLFFSFLLTWKRRLAHNKHSVCG